MLQTVTGLLFFIVFSLGWGMAEEHTYPSGPTRVIDTLLAPLYSFRTGTSIGILAEILSSSLVITPVTVLSLIHI